jgi:hypothetical protein
MILASPTASDSISDRNSSNELKLVSPDIIPNSTTQPLLIRSQSQPATHDTTLHVDQRDDSSSLSSPISRQRAHSVSFVDLKNAISVNTTVVNINGGSNKLLVSTTFPGSPNRNPPNRINRSGSSPKIMKQVQYLERQLKPNPDVDLRCRDARVRSFGPPSKNRVEAEYYTNNRINTDLGGRRFISHSLDSREVFANLILRPDDYHFALVEQQRDFGRRVALKLLGEDTLQPGSRTNNGTEDWGRDSMRQRERDSEGAEGNLSPLSPQQQQRFVSQSLIQNQSAPLSHRSSASTSSGNSDRPRLLLSSDRPIYGLIIEEVCKGILCLLDLFVIFINHKSLN